MFTDLNAICAANLINIQDARLVRRKCEQFSCPLSSFILQYESTSSLKANSCNSPLDTGSEITQVICNFSYKYQNQKDNVNSFFLIPIKRNYSTCFDLIDSQFHFNFRWIYLLILVYELMTTQVNSNLEFTTAENLWRIAKGLFVLIPKNNA